MGKVYPLCVKKKGMHLEDSNQKFRCRGTKPNDVKNPTRAKKSSRNGPAQQ